MSEESPEQSAARRYTLMAMKLIVSVALLAFLLSRVDVAELWAGARKASWTWLLIALGFYTLNMLASAWRWHLLLKSTSKGTMTRLARYIVEKCPVPKQHDLRLIVDREPVSLL